MIQLVSIRSQEIGHYLFVRQMMDISSALNIQAGWLKFCIKYLIRRKTY